MYLPLLSRLSLTVLLSSLWGCTWETHSHQCSRCDFFSLKGRPPSWDPTLKTSQALKVLQPTFLSFPLMFLVTSPLHPFVLSLPPCPVLSVDSYILSGLPPLLPPKKEYHLHAFFHPVQLQQKLYYQLLQFLLPVCQMPHLTALELSKANRSLLLHPTSNSLSHLVIFVFLCSQILYFVHLWDYEYWPLNVHPHYAK